MIKTIDAEGLKAKLDAGENIVLIDCREQNEWDEGHIEAAKLIPLSEFQERYKELNEGDEIIIQCRSGQRSMNACMFLQDEGYENLTNLEGGILGWMDEGFEVIK